MPYALRICRARVAKSPQIDIDGRRKKSNGLQNTDSLDAPEIISSWQRSRIISESMQKQLKDFFIESSTKVPNPFKMVFLKAQFLYFSKQKFYGNLASYIVRGSVTETVLGIRSEFTERFQGQHN